MPTKLSIEYFNLKTVSVPKILNTFQMHSQEQQYPST